MNHRVHSLLVGLTFACAVGTTAATFSSGSNGSYGDIVVNNGDTTQLDVPPDGVFRCGKITVNVGGTLWFKPNPLNTPVYLLATNEVVINGVLTVAGSAASGAIPGKGGPGGFDGGFGGFGTTAPQSWGGHGHGPGGGRNANQMLGAAYSGPGWSNEKTYGNVLIVPLIGGSGGAGINGNPGVGGGGGGGGLLIASDVRITINGSITARGGSSPYGGGSGGSIRLVASTGGGGGSLDVRGSTSASDGRIRIDCEDPLAFRNLSVYGPTTRGKQMFVFPAATPSLHLVHVAGQDIPVGSATGVSLELPASAPTNQIVRLRGVGFTQTIPVRISVTPEHSPAVDYDLNLNGLATPAEAEVVVAIPVGEAVTVEAWAK